MSATILPLLDRRNTRLVFYTAKRHLLSLSIAQHTSFLREGRSNPSDKVKPGRFVHRPSNTTRGGGRAGGILHIPSHAFTTQHHSWSNLIPAKFNRSKGRGRRSGLGQSGCPQDGIVSSIAEGYCGNFASTGPWRWELESSTSQKTSSRPSEGVLWWLRSLLQ